MKLADVTIGMLVHADDCAPEDADQGEVTDINHETGMVEVAWQRALICCEQLAIGLEPGPLPTTITDRQISALRREALDAGDLLQACICELALGGDGSDAEPGTEMARAAAEYTTDTARAECARVIRDAGAQS